MQVLLPCYADPELLAGALESVPERFTVHVVDGRLASFDAINGRDITPEAPEICEAHDNAVYHRPPDDRLPFGHDRPDAPDDLRYPNHCHAEYQNACIEQSEWTLKLDADERLVRFDVNTDALDPAFRYIATVLGHYNEGSFCPPRLYVPERWTFFTGDGYIPRDLCPREAPLELIQARFASGLWATRQHYGVAKDVVIRNVHDERTADYKHAREEQVRTILDAEQGV